MNANFARSLHDCRRKIDPAAGKPRRTHRGNLQLSTGTERAVAVEEVWFHDGKPIFKFAGIDSIDDAAEWSGADILVPDSERLVPEPGEYTYADLIGCQVVGEKPLGRVVGVEEYGGPSLLKVQTEDGREILVPFAKAICREIDIASKTIRVELPEGLVELQ
jgi:16S rRNA processing protein RimM